MPTELVIVEAGVQIETAISNTRAVQYGETVKKGEWLYRKTDGKFWLASCDLTAVEAAARCCALEAGVLDDWKLVIIGGEFDQGTTLANEQYVLGVTPGAVMAIGELVTGDFITLLLTGVKTDRALINLNATGYTHL